MKNRLLNLLKIGLSLGLLVLLFTHIGIGKAVQAIRGMDLRAFAATFLLFMLGILVRAYRWQGLLEAVQLRSPLRRLVVLYLVGSFFNTFMPTGVGGDVIRVYELARDSKRTPESVGTVFVDRLSGLLVLFGLALVALPFSSRLITTELRLAILAIAGGGILAAWLLFQRSWAEWVLRKFPLGDRLRGKVMELYRAVHICGTGAIGRALGVSLLFNLLLIAIVVLLALGLDIQVSLWYFPLFVPLISFSLVLPISISGLGVRETAFVLLFGQAGVEQPKALALSLAFYGLTIATGLVGGALYGLEGIRGLVGSSAMED
ncbi:MAG: lysylphosphatidylglycerol synthase transmembrane domain-containing protein [Chloroflexota bacterium]|nr:lysylphosphatidylglycerol synthase transmembrane domain-containing protein [Chloroflexota bacterium]